jgi:hypothetical protein
MTQRSADVVLLPGARLTPEVLLHQVNRNANDYQAVVVLKLGHDSMVEASWSQMKTSEICFMLTKFQAAVYAVLEGRT